MLIYYFSLLQKVNFIFWHIIYYSNTSLDVIPLMLMNSK